MAKRFQSVFARLLFVLALSLLGYTTTQAQSNVLKITPQNLIVRSLSPSFERVISGPHAVSFGFSGIFPWNALNTANLFGIDPEGENWDVTQLRYSGFTLTPEYRYYFLGDAPKGWYAAGFLRYFRYQAESDFTFTIDQNDNGNLNSTIRFQGLGPGAGLGYQKIYRSGLAIDIQLGLGFAIGGMRLSGDFSNLLPEELAPAITQANEYLEQIPLINVSIPNQESFSVSAPIYAGPWPILRTSVSIGYAF